MKLSELHKRLSRKPSYTKAYDAIGDVILIGAAVRKLRKEEEITQSELVSELGISHSYLSRLETGSGRVEPAVVAAVVRRFETPLRKLGINVEPWLAIKLPERELPPARSHDRSRSSVIPQGVSRSRYPTHERERESLVRERRSHKYKTKTG